MCTGAPGTASNRIKDVSRTAENSAFTETLVKILELNNRNLHNCLKRLPSLHTYENDQDRAVRKSEHAHLVRVPRCQRRHRGGRPGRAAERNRILEFSSKISFNTLKYYEPDFGLPRVPTNVAHFLHELSCQTGREPTAGLLVDNTL